MPVLSDETKNKYFRLADLQGARLFSRWVAPPQTKGPAYAEFQRQHVHANSKSDRLKGVPSHQQNKSEARVLVNRELGRQKTQFEMEKFVKTLASEEEQMAWRTWWHQSGQDVNNEVELTYWLNDIHLRFKPSPTGRKEREDGTLHGKYEAYVVTPEGEKKYFEVLGDWVRKNISEAAREVIHRVATDTNFRLTDKHGRTEHGFLSLDGNDGTDAIFDHRQISMIRYIPPKVKVNDDGEEIRHPQKWRGAIHTEKGREAEFVDLPQDWMDSNISEDLQKFIKSIWEIGSEGYVRIPESAPADHKEEDLKLLLNGKDAPRLKYRRGGTISNGDRSCVLKGAASCLHYLGYKRLAFALCNDISSGHKMEQGFEFFQRMLDPTELKKEEGEKKLQLVKDKPRRNKNWDIFRDSKEYLMCLVGLHGSDGKKDHAVSIAGEWIFDSNVEYALPLTRNSLDLCCSDGSTKNRFIGVTRVCMLKLH